MSLEILNDKNCSMAFDLRSRELEHAFIKDRINSVEKHFSDIGSKLSVYIKKIAHVRDSGDDLAKCILSYASKENLNLSLRNSLTQFADIFFALQEYRDAQIQRTDGKIVVEFANYKPICKKAKEELKPIFEIRTKELSKKNKLEKTVSKNPSNCQKIIQAEVEVSQAKDKATRATLELSRIMDHFERQKIDDIQHAFLEFIKIEMIFHAKAVELYTKAYNTIKKIKVEDDLEGFRSHFRSYSLPSEYENLSGDDGKNKMDYLLSGDAPNPETKTNLSSKNFDPIGDASNLSLNLAMTNKTVDTTSPKTCVNSVPYKKKQELQKWDQSSKASLSRIDNSNTSFDSFVETKFEFRERV